MARASATEMTLIGLVAAMFLTNLLLIGLVASYASKVTNNDYLYQSVKEDYTRQIQRLDEEQRVRNGRTQEQINGIKFTMDRRFDMLEEMEYLKRRQKE